MKKQTKRLTAYLWLTLAAAVLTACTDSDNPVEASAVDNGTWTIDEAKDLSVRPGDDFFTYCSGTWIANTPFEANSPDVVGFYSTQQDKNISALQTPEIMATSKKLAADAMTAAGQHVEETDRMLQQATDVLNAATTREALWKAAAQLIKQGYQMPFGVVALPKTGRVCGLFTLMPFEWTELPAMSRAAQMTEKLRTAEFAETLVPVVGKETTRGGVTEEWPMIKTLCDELGYNIADIYISPEDFSFGRGQDAKGVELLRQMQAMEPDDLRQVMAEYINNDRSVYDANIVTMYVAGLIAGNLRMYSNYDQSARFGRAYYDEAMCQRGRDLCEQLRQAFKERLEQNQWLSEATRAKALKKLAAMKVFAGMPAEFYDEGMVDISACETLLEDMMTVRRSYRALQHRLVGKSMDEVGFHIYLSTFATLDTNNAAYLSIANSIFIPPIWLMSPVYQVGANSAYNFATPCCVIAHEMTHGFDTTGSRYDEYGDFGSIWTSEADAQAFQQKASALKACYSSFEVAPGVYANGEKTIGEDIADLGGFEIAFQAYSNYLTDNGFRGEELRLQQRRFYEAFGYFWRCKYTDEYAKKQVVADVHSLARERVNGVVSNTEAWYDLFDVKPGDKLYRKPGERIHIW